MSINPQQAFLQQLDERIALLEKRLKASKELHVDWLKQNNFDTTKLIEINAILIELKRQRETFALCFSIYE